MAMVVQHNMQAMNSNRMLGATTGAQAKSTEKLSSGFKINRAADDAAGLTISEKMRKQIKGLDRASTNAQDGVSAVQTAEGALTEVHSMLQRMNELAVQAANGTNSKSDRDAIQAEIEQLTTEVDRVAETTKFNETYLLKGDNTQAAKTINLAAHDAGLKGTLVDNGDGTATFTMDKLKAGDGVTIGGKSYTIGAAAGSAAALAKAGAGKASAGVAWAPGDKVTVNNIEYTYVSTASMAAGWYAGTPVSGEGKADAALFKAGANVESGTKKFHVIDPDANGVDKNDATVITETHAYELAKAELKTANGIGDTKGHANVTNAVNKFTIQTGQAEIPSALSFNLHVGSDADMTNKINVNVESMTSDYLGIKGLNVSDDSGNAATYAIDAIADAVAKVSEQRSALGAIQNRLEHTIANLDNISENTTAAESRIRDTDMASEMVTYSKNNILAQAGQAMLAQANQSTQGVLSLLG
jgi:flagellin